MWSVLNQHSPLSASEEGQIDALSCYWSNKLDQDNEELLARLLNRGRRVTRTPYLQSFRRGGTHSIDLRQQEEEFIWRTIMSVKRRPHVKHGLFSLMIAWRIPDLKSCAVVSQRSMQAESEQSEEYGSVGTFLQSPSPLTLSLALHFHIQKHNRATYRQPSFRKQAHAPRGRISWDKVEQCHAGPRLQPSWNSWVGWRVGPPDRLRQNALA